MLAVFRLPRRARLSGTLSGAMVPSRTVVKTGLSMMGNPSRTLGYKPTGYSKSPPGDPRLFFAQTTVLALYRNGLFLLTAIFVIIINMTITLAAIRNSGNDDLLDLTVRSFYLLQDFPGR